MELIDFLAVCSDNAHITVSDTDDNLLGVYDGKNSIDNKYNRCRVLGIGTRQHSRHETFDIIVEVSDAQV